MAIVDVRMPPTYTDEGVRAAIAIRAAHPDTAVLVFSQWVETGYARQLLREQPGRGSATCSRTGSSAPDAFLDALRRIAAGGTALDPEVIRQLLAAPRSDAGLARLTAASGRSSGCSPRAGRTSRSRRTCTWPAAASRST